jgi:hypothetical protein
VNTLALALAAGTLLLGNAAWAKADASESAAVRFPDASASEQTRPMPRAAVRSGANPTGLPAYEMRTDGLMINGLLSASGWQG